MQINERKDLHMQATVKAKVLELKHAGKSLADITAELEEQSTRGTIANYFYQDNVDQRAKQKAKPKAEAKPKAKAKAKPIAEDEEIPPLPIPKFPDSQVTDEFLRLESYRELHKLRTKLAACRTIMRGLIEYAGLSND